MARQDDLHALLESVQRIDDRTRDLATRADLEKLRAEIMSVMVTKDGLEPRINNITDRLLRTENGLVSQAREQDEWVKTFAAGADKAHKDIYNEIDNRMKEKQAQSLSSTDRVWLRVGQVGGMASLVISILSYIAFHLRWQ